MQEFLKAFAKVAATTVCVLGGIYVGGRITAAAISASEWTGEKAADGVSNFRTKRAEKRAAKAAAKAQAQAA